MQKKIWRNRWWKGHSGFSSDSLESLNSSDGEKQNQATLLRAPTAPRHTQSKHATPEGGHTELWLQIFRDGGRILARRWRGLERQRAAKRLFSFAEQRATANSASHSERFAAQSSQKRHIENISTNTCVSDLTCEAALTVHVDVSIRERLHFLDVHRVCGKIVERVAAVFSVSFFFYINQSGALKCFQISSAENIFCFIISSWPEHTHAVRRLFRC